MASRRNGARSKGPKTLAGKQQSSINAVKHNLRGNPATILQGLPLWLAPLAEELRTIAKDSPEGTVLAERIVIAEFNRHRAAELLDKLVAELTDPENAIAALKDLFSGGIPRTQDLEFALIRMMVAGYERDWRKCRVYLAYEKRFRGQRDRGLRELTKLAKHAAINQGG